MTSAEIKEIFLAQIRVIELSLSSVESDEVLSDEIKSPEQICKDEVSGPHIQDVEVLSDKDDGLPTGKTEEEWNLKPSPQTQTLLDLHASQQRVRALEAERVSNAPAESGVLVIDA